MTICIYYVYIVSLDKKFLEACLFCKSPFVYKASGNDGHLYFFLIVYLFLEREEGREKER